MVRSRIAVALVFLLVARLAAAPRRSGAVLRRGQSRPRSLSIVRPAAGEPPLDDVNWFARPVPNAKGDWIVAVASHNLNYLYNLTTGARVRIPDKSDAVATPDGRYITVPSHYTAANTVNFYDAADAARSSRGRQGRRRRAARLRAPHADVARRLLPVGRRRCRNDRRARRGTRPSTA